MINDETQETVLENTVEETQEEAETETVEAEDSKDWKAEALKYKAILDRNKNKKEDHVETKERPKSDDFGYDVKAYLKASGIKADEFDFVRKELKSFGGDVDALIDNDYFQQKLEKQRALDKTAEATPKGKRTGSPATDSVDYWMAKPFDQVPQDMRAKVVNARLEKEQRQGIFYNS
jgi:hypothetical protein